MASEKVSRKMVLEVNANNAVIHTENLVTGILAKISPGTGIWAKFRLGTGIWYPLHDPLKNTTQHQTYNSTMKTHPLISRVANLNRPVLLEEKRNTFF